MGESSTDVVVVGAGPYGLSVAAYARAAGLAVRVFGRVMDSWERHMPAGMYLKSEPWASDLAASGGRGTLAAYCAAHREPYGHGLPVPVEQFTAYGHWFAEHHVGEVEEGSVVSVAALGVQGPKGCRYAVTLASGDTVKAAAVVLAVGVLPFAVVPGKLSGLPAGLASHSGDHHDLSGFAGRDVTVIGAGQSALETAALLAEAGAAPRLVARTRSLAWNADPLPEYRPPRARAIAPQSGLGPGWSNWAWSNLPQAVRALPLRTRQQIVRTRLGPAGAWWLRPRVEGRFPVLLGTTVEDAAARPGEGPGSVRLTLRTAHGTVEQVETDHVIAATGYTPDLARIDLLAPGLRSLLLRDGTTPALSARFESSAPGLYFVGLAAAYAFGPVQRFVYGARFAARQVTAGLRADGLRPRPAVHARAEAVVRARAVPPVGVAEAAPAAAAAPRREEP